MRKIKIGDCYKDGEYTFVIDFGYDKTCLSVITADGGGPAIGSIGYLSESEIASSISPLPTLHLPIKGKWFDMILSGVKKEEYRDIAGAKKSYRNVGLLTSCKASLAAYEANMFGELYFNGLLKSRQFQVKPWKVLHLTHGYGYHLPQLWVHIESITIGKGKPEWGAPAEDVFILKLGEVFHTKNLRQ